MVAQFVAQHLAVGAALHGLPCIRLMLRSLVRMALWRRSGRIGTVNALGFGEQDFLCGNIWPSGSPSGCSELELVLPPDDGVQAEQAAAQE